MALDGAAGARALIALHRSDTGAAQAALATARGEAAARSHHMTVLARSLLAEPTHGAGATLARAGASAGARRWLDGALQVYERLDATWDTSRATSRLRASGVRLGSREARARPTAGWEALTRSQRAVVELVAQGHSNP